MTINLSRRRFLKRPLTTYFFSRRIGLITLSLLALTLMPGSVEVSAQQASAGERPPQVGLRLLEVAEGSPADKAGLKPMDTLVKYGDFAVVDSASYFAARDAYEKSPDAKVAIVYWRGRERFESLISSPRLGIRFNEYNPVAYELGIFISEFTSALEVPEYTREAETAKGKMRSAERIAADARALIERAALEGTLTPAQVLVARISMFANNAPAAEIEKQTELIKELLSTQPLSFTNYLGFEVFFRQKRYRPAIECFKRALNAEPSDVNVRLNMGLAYIELRMFSEAEDAASYVFNSTKIRLNEHGFGIAFQVKAAAALGRRDFAKAADYAEKAFQYSPSRSYLMSLWQLAAAQNGDLAKFYQVIETTKKAIPQEFANLRGRTDAVEAYALAKSNQPEKARQIAWRWLGRDSLDANARYWKQYPSGDDVVKSWKELQAQN